MAPIKVIVVGASGQNGTSIVQGLLASTTAFDIVALSRQSSLDKPRTQALRDAGVSVVAADITGPKDALVAVLKDADVVISAVTALALRDQIPLIDAAKAANVKRFIPCTYATASPPRGIMALAELKDDVFCHIKAQHLPYTIIDVGWWYEIAAPRVPSGRMDSVLINPPKEILGGGKVPSALTHTRDIGTFVARIIADERTLNRMVFCYGTVMTQSQVWDAVETASGEKLDRVYVSDDEVASRAIEARKAATFDNPMSILGLWGVEYQQSWGIRGDNTPEVAKYLGYLDARELYPDITPTTFEQYVEAALAGKEKMPWA